LPTPRGWYNPHWHYEHEPETRAALDLIFSDHFSRHEPGIFGPLRDVLLTGGDHYMHLADLRSYLEADGRLVALYRDAERLAHKAILNVAASGRFSSDRHRRRICDRDLATPGPAPSPSKALPWHFPARRQAGTERDADRSGAARTGILRPQALTQLSPAQQISFGTSGHRALRSRGRSTKRTSWRSLRRSATTGADIGISGPLYMGRDTHAVSGPAQRTALEVLAANGVETVIQGGNGVTPTPAISRVILAHNRGRNRSPG